MTLEAKALTCDRFPAASTEWWSSRDPTPRSKSCASVERLAFRGHDWHHTIEMSGATVLVGVLLIGGFWLGVISQHGLIEWQIRLACPVMVAVMLLRAGFYSQTHTAHRSTAQVN